MRPDDAGARWVPRQNLHVTLFFLGRVDDPRVAEVSGAIGSAVGGLVDFPLQLEGLGAFPNPRRARVLWAGLADPAGGLRALAGAVADALEPLGFAREERAFRGHVTLARLDRPAPVRLDASVAPMRFTADRVILFESRLSRPAPAYAPVATFPFHRSAAPPRPD